MKKLLLVDGHSLAYRAFFALPSSMTTKDGQPTNAIYGFINMLLSIINKEKPDMVAVAFDLKAPTFRHIMYPEYKANREKTPDEFISQVPFIKEFVVTIGIPLVEKEGFEADDILGTLTRLAPQSDPNLKAYILTGDRDVLQLINTNTFAILTKKGISEILLLDEAGVKDNYDITPRQVVDYKALKGDASDNIPGVAGVGDKTATKLLNEFGSLDKIYENLDKITSKSVKTKLETDKEKAYLSQKLARIDCKVPLEITFEKTAISLEQAIPFFQKLELQNLAKRFLDANLDQPAPTDTNVEITLVSTEEKWDKLLKELNQSKTFGFLLNTDSSKNIVGISLATSDIKGYYIPLKHNTNNLGIRQQNLGPMFSAITQDNLEAIKPLFLTKKQEIVSHESKDVKKILDQSKLPIPKIFYDTLLLDNLLFPDRTSYSLEKIVKDIFRITIPENKDLLSEFKAKDIKNIDPEKIYTELGKRATYLIKLKDHYIKEAKKENLYTMYLEMDMPCVEILKQMEDEGIKIDTSYLKDLSKSLHTATKKLEEDIYILAGEKFNLNSPKQLGTILFEKLQLPAAKKTKTGFSTDVSVLETLAQNFDIAKQLIDYRQKTKLLNTYIDVLPKLVDKNDRLHTTFHIAGTATGRLSSSNPNLQNIPIRTEEGEKIRKAFISKENHSFVVADYSQIDLRVLAHMAEETKLIEAFNNDFDIHTATASSIFSIPLEAVTQTMRRKAKEINFGLAYGMNAFGLSKRLNIPQKEATEFIELYFNNYPKILTFLEDSVNFVKANGFISTIFGRKRFFRNYNNVGKKDQNSLDRMIINTPVQGSSADIIKLAMLDLSKKLQKTNSKILLQIHDELLIETPDKDAEEIADLAKKTMEKVCTLSVPLKTNVGIGKNWLEAK